MLNRSASLAMSTRVLKALPCKLDIKRHSPRILYLLEGLNRFNGAPTSPLILRDKSLPLYLSCPEPLIFKKVIQALLCVHSSFAIILKRNRNMFALQLLSHRCIITINVLWLFLALPWVGLLCVIVVFLTYSLTFEWYSHVKKFFVTIENF